MKVEGLLFAFFAPHSWMPIALAVGFGLTALGTMGEPPTSPRRFLD